MIHTPIKIDEAAISLMAAQHRTRAQRRARLREALRHSSDANERNAVRMAEYGHAIRTIMELCGVSEGIARTLVTGEAP